MTFWPENETYFWHKEWTSFKTWEVGIFISKCFKSRFRVETWTPVVRLILITCELLSRVTEGCLVVLTFLRIFTGNEILSWQYCKCGGSCHSFPRRFVVADMLHSPCCLSILSLPQPLHGAFPTLGIEQHQRGTDKFSQVGSASQHSLCGNENWLLGSAAQNPCASLSVLQADGPSACSELGGTCVPWIRNCQFHLLRGYIFSSSQWNISRMIQTWM